MITVETNTITAPDELNMVIAMDILDRFVQLNEISMMSTICTMIDTLSAKYGEAPASITEKITEAVTAINEIDGAYRLY